MVLAQIEAVFDALAPAAVKTGMLYSVPIVRVVARWRRSRRTVPLIVDPVMISTSGARLLTGPLPKVLGRELLPESDLVTPNLDEAAALLGGARAESVQEMRRAARAVQGQFGCAVLVKGGHLRNMKQAIDIFYDGKNELLLEAPFIRGVSTHGTGCTYAAAIAAYLALGHDLVSSVERAKGYITEAIFRTYKVGHYNALG
jgi:hydroxymethylpyrimidine/phosphomethylpyrimidine kinase